MCLCHANLRSSDPSSFFLRSSAEFRASPKKKKGRAPDSSVVFCLHYTESKHTQYQFFVTSVSLRSCPPSISTAVVRRRDFFFPSLLRKKKKLAWSPVKRAAKTGNLFCNIAAKRVEKRCCAFYHQRSDLSYDKSGCCRLRKKLQKVESSSTFCNNVLFARFTVPRQPCMAASDGTPVYGVIPA